MKSKQYDFLNKNYIMRTTICMPMWTGQFYKVPYLEVDLKWVKRCRAGESVLSREELPHVCLNSCSLFVCMCMYLCICMWKCMHLCLCMYVYLCTCVCICKHVYAQVYTLICMVMGVAERGKDSKRDLNTVLMYEIKQNSSRKRRRKKLKTIVFLVDDCPQCSS